jgi:hypothetical protein
MSLKEEEETLKISLREEVVCGPSNRQLSIGQKEKLHQKPPLFNLMDLDVQSPEL